MFPDAGAQETLLSNDVSPSQSAPPVTGVPPITAGAVVSRESTPPLSGDPVAVPGTWTSASVEVARNTSALPRAPAGPAPIVWLADSRLSGPPPAVPKSGSVNVVPSTVTALPGCQPAAVSCA